MEPSNNASTPRQRLHPLVATAAISVIVLSAVGVTAFVMNRSAATPSPYDASPAPVAAVAPQPVEAAPAPAVVSAPKPVVRAAPAAPDNVPRSPNYASSGAQPVEPRYSEAPIAQAAPVCQSCGVVDSMHEIKVKGQGTGVGAVGGAVVGGLLGNMVGAGRGKALATVAGAVGGGLGGNAIEKNVRSGVEHQMVVRLDNGTTRTFTQASPFPYGIGERVRIVNGHVERG